MNKKKSLDDRYGNPEFKTIIPICSVCKNYSDDFKCNLHKDSDNKYKYGKDFDCASVVYDKDTIRYKWYLKQQKKGYSTL